MASQSHAAQTVINQINADTSPTAMPEVTFPTIVVTATRIPKLLNNTIAQTIVINEAALQRYRGQSVLDVLHGQLGFNVSQSGGDGTLSNFYLRGFDNKQILVLIDGIRYGSVASGGAALNLLPADQIDRIEIIQGASGSSLYGSDAMGGVIQVFTKGQSAKYSNVAVTVGAGSQNSYKAQVTGQYVEGGTTLSLSAGRDKTDGIDATLPSSWGHENDKDGFTSNNYSLVLKHSLNSDVDLGLTGILADSTSDYDNDGKRNNTHADNKNGGASAFANYHHDKLTANLKYGESFDENDNFVDNAGTGYYYSKQKQVNLQLGYQLPLGNLIAGYENLRQSVDSDSTYSQDARSVNSVFLGYNVSQPTYDFQANIRHDDNSDYGNQTTYNVGAAYRILPNTRLGASYATGFRAPSFFETYAYNPAWNYISNPDLKPEESDNSEVFIEHSNDLQKTRLTGYYSDVKNLITYVTDSNFVGQSQNTSKSRIKGINLASDWQLDKTIFGINYDYQKTENRDTTYRDNELAYRPKNKGMVYLGYREPTFDIRAEAEHVGERFTNAANTKSLGDYTLLNVSGNYYVNPNLTLSSRINNLTDKDYQTIDGYRQKGINAFISATYQWF